MSKSTKKPSSQLVRAKANATNASPQATSNPEQPKQSDTGTKQSRVMAMLQSPTGATIAAMMKATDWQQHSVRGFLAGVVRKRLKLKLSSKKSDSGRVYQITGGEGSKSRPRQSKRRAL
jgi:Protein of unknown function (DUF3489)